MEVLLYSLRGAGVCGRGDDLEAGVSIAGKRYPDVDDAPISRSRHPGLWGRIMVALVHAASEFQRCIGGHRRFYFFVNIGERLVPVLPRYGRVKCN